MGNVQPQPTPQSAHTQRWRYLDAAASIATPLALIGLSLYLASVFAIEYSNPLLFWLLAGTSTSGIVIHAWTRSWKVSVIEAALLFGILHMVLLATGDVKAGLDPAFEIAAKRELEVHPWPLDPAATDYYLVYPSLGPILPIFLNSLQMVSGVTDYVGIRASPLIVDAVVLIAFVAVLRRLEIPPAARGLSIIALTLNWKIFGYWYSRQIMGTELFFVLLLLGVLSVATGDRRFFVLTAALALVMPLAHDLSAVMGGLLLLTLAGATLLAAAYRSHPNRGVFRSGKHVLMSAVVLFLVLMIYTAYLAPLLIIQAAGALQTLQFERLNVATTGTSLRNLLAPIAYEYFTIACALFLALGTRSKDTRIKLYCSVGLLWLIGMTVLFKYVIREIPYHRLFPFVWAVTLPFLFAWLVQTRQRGPTIAVVLGFLVMNALLIPPNLYAPSVEPDYANGEYALYHSVHDDAAASWRPIGGEITGSSVAFRTLFYHQQVPVKIDVKLLVTGELDPRRPTPDWIFLSAQDQRIVVADFGKAWGTPKPDVQERLETQARFDRVYDNEGGTILRRSGL